MSKLRWPLRTVLAEQSLDDVELDRRAASVAECLARRRRRGMLVATCIPVILAAATVVVLLRARTVPSPGAANEPGPLSLVHASVTDRLDLVARGAARTFEFTDGSHVVLGPLTTLEVMDNDGRRFDVALRHGRATFDIRPGGPRRWVIEGGLATIEVIGTSFSVERDDTRVRVDVERGVVLVRGANVPSYVQRLTAGRTLVVGEPPPSTVPPALTARPPGPTEHKRNAATMVTSEPRPSIDDAVALADDARASGDLQRAVKLLDAVARQYPHDVRAAMAAFTAGRIFADDLHQPRRAAESFSAALHIGLPAPLEEDARARIVEAFAAAHDDSAARDAAEEYERRHPNGRFRALVRRWRGQ
jgi:transmembrane sensor